MPGDSSTPTSIGVLENTQDSVDGWIDDLDTNRHVSNPGFSLHGMSQEVLLTYFIQQQLPQITLPKFSGKPEDWVDFIVKFRDLVHKQPILTDSQRNQLLHQQLEGEANRSVKGYATDSRGYVLALKRLNYLFGQRLLIAQASCTWESDQRQCRAKK